MLNVVKTSITTGEDVTDNVAVVHAPVYTLYCEDTVGNGFEVETNKETYVQITDFLDKLRQV